MAKKAAKTTVQADPYDMGSILEFLDGREGKKETPAKTKKPAEATQPDYEAKFAALEGRIAELTDMNMALLSRGQGSSSAQAPVAQTQEPTALPDPVLDPEGYARAVVTMVQAQTRQAQTAETAAKSQESRYEEMWNEFAEAYPQHGESMDRAEFAARKVLTKAQRKGIDIDRYMNTQSERFYKDVATEMDKIFGKPSAENDGEKPAKGAENKVAEDDGDDEPNRTAAIFGGLEGGGAMSDGSEPAPASNLLKDMMDLQKRDGFL